MPKTSPPMTLDAMQTFARRQLAHYTDLVRVLDQIAHDPLSVMPQPHGPVRKPVSTSGTAPLPPGRQRGHRLSPFVRAAMQQLSVGTVVDVLAHIQAAGWRSKTTDARTHHSMVLRELKVLCAAKVLRRISAPGTRPTRYALATPTKAATKKLAAAQAMVNGSGTPRAAAAEVVN